MVNFLSNGGIELILGSVVMVWVLVRTAIEERRPGSAKIIVK